MTQTQSQTDFQQLKTVLESEGAAATLIQLIQMLDDKGRHHEQFEALKMQVRQGIGLPLCYADGGDELDEGTRNKLEEGLITACRKVGTRLMQSGQPREGWMYLRPVGDQADAAELLANVEPNEENLDELIEVALHENVDVGRGFRLVLDHYGTCNAITTFESTSHQRSKPDQQLMAGMLVKHLHQELADSLRADISQNEGQEPAADTIADLVADRDWLFGEHSYHIDTTHLASVVRFARVLDDPDLISLALDLTAYGSRLNQQFQYQGEEPFADIHASHAIFFQALAGQEVDAALKYFADKARLLDPDHHGRMAIETYIDLLSRVGQHERALEAAIEMTPPGTQPIGLAPSLLELAELSGNYERLIEYCEQHDDLLGYATAIMRQQHS